MAGLDTTLGGMLSLCVIFLFLTTATVILRFFARFKQKANLQVDDWIVVAAWVSSFTICVRTIMQRFNSLWFK